MNQTEFLKRLADALDHDGELAPDQQVESIEEWDSLGILSVLELLSDLGHKVKPDTLRDINNLSELLALIGLAHHG